MFARIAELGDDDEGPVVRAEMPDKVCEIGVERDRRGRLVAARLPDDSLAAACHLTWRTGGHIWVAPKEWYRVRGNPLSPDASWRLTAEEDIEVARFDPLPAGAFGIDLMAALPDALVLLSLVAVVIRVERLAVTAGGG